MDKIGNLKTIHLILKTRANVLKMLERRGQEVGGRGDETTETVAARIPEDERQFVEEFTGRHFNGEDKRGILVYVLAGNKIKGIVRDIQAEYSELSGMDEVIFLSMTVPTELNIVGTLREFKREPGVLASILPLAMFAMDVPLHRQVADYRIIPLSEHASLFEKLLIDGASKLPILREVDPMARQYGCRKGDIVRVEHKSVVSGDQVTQRHVV